MSERGPYSVLYGHSGYVFISVLRNPRITVSYGQDGSFVVVGAGCDFTIMTDEVGSDCDEEVFATILHSNRPRRSKRRAIMLYIDRCAPQRRRRAG